MFKLARCILGAGLVFGATVASAGDLPADTADGVMGACRSDYHRICSEVVPGDGRVARCLMDHERELTSYCLQSLRIASAAEDCMPDYRRFCRDVPKGQEAFRCLAGQMERLEPTCRRVIAANAPYMQPRADHYSYNDPYNPRSYADEPPYEGPYSGPYARDGYSEPAEQYSGDLGATERQSDLRYREEPSRGNSNTSDAYHYGPGYGDRYAGDTKPRFRSYDEEDESSYGGLRPRY
jgi:hypothetical protein